uniref:PIR Superfamily Protein n=1 Tax=Strongyloides venezuelensis TaxID=75913 RepID=A0A0K0G5M5_STRVS
MLEINSFLLIENLNINKKQILYQNLSYSFYVITEFNLNNNKINIERSKEILRNKTQHLGNEIYRQTCISKNNRLKEVRENHTPEENVRTYLHRADVKPVSTNRKNVIIVKIPVLTENSSKRSESLIKNIGPASLFSTLFGLFFHCIGPWFCRCTGDN